MSRLDISISCFANQVAYLNKSSNISSRILIPAGFWSLGSIDTQTLALEKRKSKKTKVCLNLKWLSIKFENGWPHSIYHDGGGGLVVSSQNLWIRHWKLQWLKSKKFQCQGSRKTIFPSLSYCYTFQSLVKNLYIGYFFVLAFPYSFYEA